MSLHAAALLIAYVIIADLALAAVLLLEQIAARYAGLQTAREELAYARLDRRARKQGRHRGQSTAETRGGGEPSYLTELPVPVADAMTAIRDHQVADGEDTAAVLGMRFK